MFQTDHLSDEQLAATARAEAVDVGLEFHLRSCIDCKRRLGGALLMKGLMPAEGNATSAGAHLSAAELDRLHAFLFEGGESNAERPFERYRHVTGCESCFARFFNLHLELSPPTRAVDQAVADFAAAKPRQIVGRLSIFRALGDARIRLSRAFAEIAPLAFPESLLKALAARDSLGTPPEPEVSFDDLLSGEPSVAQASAMEEGEEVSYSRSAAFSSRMMVAERRRGSATRRQLLAQIQEVSQQIEVLKMYLNELESRLAALDAESIATNAEELSLAEAGLTVSLQVQFHGESAVVAFMVRNSNSGAPVAGATFTLLDPEGGPINTATSGDGGRAEMELPIEASRLQIRVSTSSKVWEVELTPWDDDYDL